MLMQCYLFDVFPLMSSECSYIDKFGLPFLGLNLEIMNRSSQIIFSVELLPFHQRDNSLCLKLRKCENLLLFFE